MSVEQTLVVAVVSVVIGAVVGAVLTAALQYSFWKRQHREELKSLEERETRGERARAAERLREVASLLIETSRVPISGPDINRSDVSTTTLIESYRLRRELLNAASAVRDAFPNHQSTTLVPFLKMTERVPLEPESAGRLRAELDAILAALRADVSLSDK